jgi:hypothetical protein
MFSPALVFLSLGSSFHPLLLSSLTVIPNRLREIPRKVFAAIHEWRNSPNVRSFHSIVFELYLSRRGEWVESEVELKGALLPEVAVEAAMKDEN